MNNFVLFFISILLFSSTINATVKPADHVTGGYDVHIHFDMKDKDHAYQVYENFLAFLKEEHIDFASAGFYTEVFDRSPHLKPMWEVDFKQKDHLFETMGIVISWLMLNREGLTVLIHPNTENRTRESKIRDHTIYTLWMGEPDTLNVDPEIFTDESLKSTL